MDTTIHLTQPSVRRYQHRVLARHTTVGSKNCRVTSFLAPSASSPPDTTALGLTEVVNQMKAANDEFNAVYTSRSGEISSRQVASKMRELRPKVDEAYRALVQGLNAVYGANALVAKDAEVEKALVPVIDGINALISQLGKTVGMRQTAAQNKKEKQKALNPDEIVGPKK